MLLSKNLLGMTPALALLSAGGADAFPANSSTYINVHIPRSLHKNSTNGTWGYPHQRGRIGTASDRLPPQGSMALNVYLASDDICTFPLDKASGYPARPKDPATGKMREWQPPFILMADAGNCTFAAKARNAQMAGAAAVLFADTLCLCSDAHCVANQAQNDTECLSEEPAVVDDGSGSDVSIPSFLLYKSGAEQIKDTLKKNVPVLVDVRWHPPRTVDYVNYTIWMDPLDNSTKDLLREFKPVALALGGSKARFRPQYFVHDGALSKCVGNTGEEFCRDVCANNGRYCYPSAAIPGSAVVKESLRRMCVWKHHGHDDDGVGEVWWEYVTFFDDHCGNLNATFSDEKCIEEAYKHAKVSADDVKQCMADSGGTDQDGENQLLQQAIKDRTDDGVYISPTIHIDRQTLSWTTAADMPTRAMLETICGGFEAGHVPEVCARCLGAEDVVSCAASDKHHGGDDNGGGDVKPPKKQSHTFRNVMIFLLLGLLAGGGFYAYKMRDSHTDSSWNLRYAILGDNDGGDRA